MTSLGRTTGQSLAPSGNEQRDTATHRCGEWAEAAATPRPPRPADEQPTTAAPLSQRRKTTYCDECQLWLPCHKYDAPYRAEEVLYLCDVCVLEVQP